MAYIRVDHSKFEGTASSVDTYVTELKTKMKKAQNEVNTMFAEWSGADYVEFKNRFDRLDDDESTHRFMVTAFESYAEFLRFAGQKYKNAQVDAVNRANRLPKYK